MWDLVDFLIGWDAITGGCGATLGKVGTGGEKESVLVPETEAIGKGSGLELYAGSEDDEEDCANGSQALKEWLGIFEMLIGVTNVSTSGARVSTLETKVKGSDRSHLSTAKGKILSWKTTSLDIKIVLVDKSRSL